MEISFGIDIFFLPALEVFNLVRNLFFSFEEMCPGSTGQDP